VIVPVKGTSAMCASDELGVASEKASLRDSLARDVSDGGHAVEGTVLVCPVNGKRTVGGCGGSGMSDAVGEGGTVMDTG
jgi:hypothetical protein